MLLGVMWRRRAGSVEGLSEDLVGEAVGLVVLIVKSCRSQGPG